MRLPQPLLESRFFALASVEEVSVALGKSSLPSEIEAMRLLAESGLPPVTSVEALAVMIGINPGIVWSFANRPHKHYRVFEIPKGKGVRTIAAPRVGLKVIQTWIGYHLSRAVKLPPHVFGFVPGISHIDAAFEHREADWAYSIDISNYFGTTPASVVASSLESLGYPSSAAQLIARLSSLGGYLTQGSPMSPVLSNLAFLKVDANLFALASRFDARLTRYADDIVFSGNGILPSGLADSVKLIFANGPWSLSPEKERIEPVKGRIKVHGLVVNGHKVRLTKGYRNKIRAYRHILKSKAEVCNSSALEGHVRYANHVAQRLEALSNNPPRPTVYDFPEAFFAEGSNFDMRGKSSSAITRMVSRIARLFD